MGSLGMALISHENNKRNLTIWLKEGDFLTNTIPVLEFPNKDLNLAIDPPVEKRVRESVLPVLVRNQITHLPLLWMMVEMRMTGS